LEKARQLFPTSDALTTQLGVIEMKTGRLQEAESLLELAAQENPASAERWYNLASIERMAGQPSKAREACAQALRLDPQNQEALRLQTELEHDLKAAPAPKPPVLK
jgi:predicted Zn-dependent protease